MKKSQIIIITATLSSVVFLGLPINAKEADQEYTNSSTATHYEEVHPAVEKNTDAHSLTIGTSYQNGNSRERTYYVNKSTDTAGTVHKVDEGTSTLTTISTTSDGTTEKNAVVKKTDDGSVTVKTTAGVDKTYSKSTE